jgi:hypothetical protein
MQFRRRRSAVRWPPKDGQPKPTLAMSLFANNERCAGRVDGRPGRTEADDDVASFERRCVDVPICGLASPNVEVSRSRKQAKLACGCRLDCGLGYGA